MKRGRRYCEGCETYLPLESFRGRSGPRHLCVPCREWVAAAPSHSDRCAATHRAEQLVARTIVFLGDFNYTPPATLTDTTTPLHTRLRTAFECMTRLRPQSELTGALELHILAWEDVICAYPT